MYETKSLIEAARERGITISRRKLSDWANRGLLAHPIRYGMGHGKGVIFKWPTETLERINAIFPAMEGFHDERFAIMLLWLLGFEVPMDKVRTAIISTREAFLSFATLHRDMLKELGTSSSRDDQADWLSNVAVDLADEAPDRAEDLEGLFHLFVGSRPDPGIIDAWIRRLTEGQSIRLPSKREISSVLNFLRTGIPLHTVVETANAKSNNDWLTARQRWLHILRSLRRLSHGLDLNQEAFRLAGYQLIISLGPPTFLALLLFQDPRTRHWIATVDKATRDFEAEVQTNPKQFEAINQIVLRRAKHLANQDKLRRPKAKRHPSRKQPNRSTQ